MMTNNNNKQQQQQTTTIRNDNKGTIQWYKGTTRWYDGTKSQYHDGMEDGKEGAKGLRTNTTITWRQGTVSRMTMRMKRTRITGVTITKKMKVTMTKWAVRWRLSRAL